MRKWHYENIDHKTLDLCKLCYEMDFEIQISIHETSTIVYEYIKYKYGDPTLQCSFCNVDVHMYKLLTKKIFDFELDHKNPMAKKGSVGCMIFQGIPVKEILDEVDRCRILCICCHGIKSSYERKLGIPQVLRFQTTEKQKETLQLLHKFTKSYIKQHLK